jgi:WhiB family redox-sensing transcriptional regulator
MSTQQFGPPWMSRGLCIGAATAYFFPKYDSPTSTAEAKKICALCPVRVECLEWALEHDEEGVWGGTSDADRRLLTRKKSRTSCPTCSSDMIVEEKGGEVCLACGVSWLT